MNFKKLKQTLLAGLMMFATAGSTLSVSAAQTVYDEYDADRKGSITLFKYVSNDGKSIESTGTSLGQNTSEQLGAIQQATGSYRMLPEQGVTFMLKRIGQYEQISDSNSTKRYVRDLDAGFVEMLKDYGITLNSENKNGLTVYDADSVTAATEKLCKATNAAATGEEAARAYVKKDGQYFDSKTSSYGKTTTGNLDLGLYMVAEVDWEHQSIAKHDTYWARTEGTEDAGDGSSQADIVSPSSPFLVSIPVTNVVEMTSGGKTYAPGEGWLYDVVAYPKNGSLAVHKDIVVNQQGDGKDNDGLDTTKTETLCDFAQLNYLNSNRNGEYDQGYDDDTQIDGDKTAFLTHQIDVSMGDTVRQVISSDVPALIGEKLNRKYAITDRMTQGLTFTQLDRVTLGTGVWNDDANTELVQDADYTLSVADNKKSFTVELTAAGLAKLDAVGTASYLYVEFDSVLNRDAMIGTDTYQYTTADENTVDATNQNTAMLTYATDRTGEHDYYSNTCRVYTYEIDISKEIPNLPADRNYSDVSFRMTGSTANGPENMKFIKEADGVYHVYDIISDDAGAVTETINADAAGNLSIKGVDARDYVITELSTVSGYQLLAEPVTFRLEGHKQVDGYDRYCENGVLDHAYAWTGEEPLKLAKYDTANAAEYKEALTKGRSKYKISNNAFYMMRTGGKGAILYFVVGGIVIAAGALMIMKKKKEDGEE